MLKIPFNLESIGPQCNMNHGRKKEVKILTVDQYLALI